MADYNVQMKQYNGTSFDNILPYASQALTLAGGGDATEIIAQARAGLSQIATGSYVGTGTYGQNNPTTIICGFKPRIIFIFTPTTCYTGSQIYVSIDGADYVYKHNGIETEYSNSADIEHQGITYYCLIDNDLPVLVYSSSSGRDAGSYIILHKSFTTTSVSFYCSSYAVLDTRPSNLKGEDQRQGKWQFNATGVKYNYIAFA